VKTTFEWFNTAFEKEIGICYYKYPIVGMSGTPDLIFLFQEFEPVIVKCFPFTIEQILEVDESSWLVRKEKQPIEIDSPELTLDDLSTELRTRFPKVRQLHRALLQRAANGERADPAC
jgi:hypothetical protein